MSLEERAAEASAALRSERAGERRRAAGTLSALLAGGAAGALLSDNARRGSGLGWAHVWRDVRDLALKESVKFESNRSFENIQATCSSLLHAVVSGAIKGNAHIKCDEIMEACLMVLKDSRLTKAFGQAYVNLLHKHVLPCKFYLGSITPQSWDDLLTACVSISCREQINHDTNVDYLTNLRLILQIIQNAVAACHFAIPFRNVLPNLKVSFIHGTNDNKVQEALLGIGIQILKTLSSECRLTTCEFTEAIIPVVLKYYEQNADKKKKSSLFRFLALCIALHHPNGRLENDKGSLARDWTVWNRHLLSILDLVLLEGAFLERKMSDNRFHSDGSPDTICEHYVQLSAFVFYQIIHASFPSSSTSEGECNPAKRPKLENTVKTFNDVIMKLREHAMPWLSVIAAYMKKHGDTISEMDSTVLLNILEGYISCTNNKLHWKNFQYTVCSLLSMLAEYGKDDHISHSIQSFWSSVVRYSSVDTHGHGSIHTIICFMIDKDLVDQNNIPPLLKLYKESAMPVTTDSLVTLNCLFHKYSCKLDNHDLKSVYLAWLEQLEIDSVNYKAIKELCLRLICKEKICVSPKHKLNKLENDELLMIFESLEENILATEFEIILWREKDAQCTEEDEIISLRASDTMKDKVYTYFSNKLKKEIENQKQNVLPVKLVYYVQAVLQFYNHILELKICKDAQIRNEYLWIITNKAMDLVCTSMKTPENDADLPDRICILEAIIELLSYNHCEFIENRICSCVDEDFFRALHGIINNTKTQNDDNDEFEKDDTDLHKEELRTKAIILCAVYCNKTSAPYKGDVIELIMNPTFYDFSSETEVKIAFQCINILNGNTVGEKPIDSIVKLMQAMCKALYRDPMSSMNLVRILYTMLDDIGRQSDNTMRQNCIVMLKGYLHRCQTSYYPPSMTALVYKCIDKIDELSSGQLWSNCLKNSLLNGLKSPIHSLRLYTCYSLKTFYRNLDEKQLKIFLTDLADIFKVQISMENQEMMKDEAANRTSTVLHSIVALTLARPIWMPKLIAFLLQTAKAKAIDKGIVQKVLDLIITNITHKPTVEYLKNNILSLLYYWLSMNVSVAELSYNYFGYGNLEDFYRVHMDWLVPAEVLWTRGGDIASSALIPLLKSKLNVDEETIVKNCFSNIMVLCLPFEVHEKYKVPLSRLLQGTEECGKQMFITLRGWLGCDRISSLVAQNFGNLIYLATTLLQDSQDAKDRFDILDYNISTPEPYNYSLQTYGLMIKYFDDLIGSSVMQNLCDNSPLMISNILVQLWSQIESENIFEAKLACLYRYVVLFERIPFGTPLDGYVCNFVCHSLLNTLKSTMRNKKKVRITGIICRALHLVLIKILPDKLEEIIKIIPQVISKLIILNQEDDHQYSDKLLSYLLNDMQYCLKDSIDLVDGAACFTQGRMDSYHISSDFLQSLKNYITKLTCFSIETLNDMKTFIRCHSMELLEQCRKLKDLKGFSEDCKGSIIHQLINSLTYIVTHSKDPKCILAACNCLGLIGPCDLKTLVMSAPEDLSEVTCVEPSQYLSIVVIRTLLENVFDENPKVIQETSRALKAVLNFREGKFAIELTDLNIKNLEPFMSRRKNHLGVRNVINDKYFESTLRNPSLWIASDVECHSQWLIRVITNLFKALRMENTYYVELFDLCQLKPSIAEKLLPPLLGLVISCSSESQIQCLSALLSSFYQHFYEKTYYSSQNSNVPLDKDTSLNLITKHKELVETMLKVVDFVRLQRLRYKKRKEQIENYNYLKVNYQTVAWAACMTGHSMAAVMYGELWCVSQNDGIPPVSPEATARLLDGENIQNIFRKSYIAIGETDSIYGCGTGHLSNEAEKRNHLLRMGHYSDSLLMHDVALSNPCGTQLFGLNRGVIKSLHQSGLYHMAVQYMKSLPEDTDLDDIKYECFTKLGDWSLIVDKSRLEVNMDDSKTNLECVIKAYQYSCLKDCLTIASTDSYQARLQSPLDNCKLCVAKLLQKINIENCQVIYNINSTLQILQEIEDYYDLRCKKLPVSELLTKWDVNNLMPFDDFKHVEAILSQRSLILEHAANLDCSLLSDVVDLQLKYAELALVNGRQQMSSRLVALARRLRPGGTVSLMDGRVFWANGHREVASHLVKSIIHDSSCTDRVLRANALRQYGTWMVESKCESVSDILEKYLKQSLQTLGDSGHTDTRLMVYLDLAKFSDAEYKQVVAYMKSSIFESKVKCMQNMKGTAESLKETQNNMTRDERKTMATNEKLSKLDEAEIKSTHMEKKSFLHLAMRYYLLTLSQGELSDLSVFRVISLWLDNPMLEIDSNEDTLEELLRAVPSRKFLPVLPQIAPRLTMEKTKFSTLLNYIIERCATDHPHHTLPILFALSNSHKDLMILNASGKSTQGSGRSKSVEEPRVLGARNTISRLAKTEDVLAVMINQMEQMCNAMISLANYKSKDKQSHQSIPRAEPLTKLKNLDSVLVPTINLPVNKDCFYTDFTSVVSFSNDFCLVGGINAPKKMSCKGSDGIARPILLKGEDDLRQDAVMQQVFCIVNNFLEMNQETSRHKLIIRTYKVVPLSRRSGVLEWCEGTQPLGQYLVGDSNTVGAHTKYRPKDISCRAAREMMSRCSEEGKTEKLSVFLKILNQFKPVFHHFFTENFPASVTWYERRLAYTKSVATSSMVGYMLGLGDRHVQNILIDKQTAEVVHIDFGIAFDQGKTLPTPETIPFRLTQDMVAGFGPSGVEGVFRGSCEKTLQLLRENQETLLTILEVLLCDPLFTWITPAQARQKQNITVTPRDIRGLGLTGEAGGGGGLAERALLAVGSKLCGAEGSTAGGGVAVPGLVARLLQNATDPANLCRLFAGWQPYL